MSKDEHAALRRRAEEILANREISSPVTDKTIYQVIEELNLYQIELEIQNENLIKNQQELQASQSRYAGLYHLAPVAYYTLNRDGLIVDANQSGLDLLGMNRESLLNRSFSQYVSPEFQMLFSQFRLLAMRDKLQHDCEMMLQKWSGPCFHALVKCKLIHHIYDEDEHFLICVNDISSQKNAEKAMQSQRAKIAAIDRMRSMNEQIYTLSRQQNHALNVMSNYIAGCVRRLEAEKFDSNELLEIMRKVTTQSIELSNMISQASNLSSKSVLRYEPSDMNTIITDTVSLLQAETDDFPVTIQFSSTDRLPSVKIDKLHIQQVLLSLARNAIEAMADAKTPLPKLLIEVRALNDSEIAINVFDNGPGFSLDLLQKIFEPNFTTKSYALGLGLPTSRTIVEKHGGVLSAHANPAGGARFEFTLPCTALSP